MSIERGRQRGRTSSSLSAPPTPTPCFPRLPQPSRDPLRARQASQGNTYDSGYQHAMQASTATLTSGNPFYTQDGNPSYASGYNQSMDGGHHMSYELDDDMKQPLNEGMMKPSSYQLSDPQEYPMPMAPYSNMRTSELGPEDSASQVAWAQRQQGPKRGLTRKVKLTRGNWVVDHRVPTAVRNSIEPKWSQGEQIQ